jgi:hypothetical protein
MRTHHRRRMNRSWKRYWRHSVQILQLRISRATWHALRTLARVKNGGPYLAKSTRSKTNKKFIQIPLQRCLRTLLSRSSPIVLELRPARKLNSQICSMPWKTEWTKPTRYWLGTLITAGSPRWQNLKNYSRASAWPAKNKYSWEIKTSMG